MFFGCRSEQKDFFFRDEWEALAEQGVLSIVTAFSRDQVSYFYLVCCSLNMLVDAMLVFKFPILLCFVC